MPLFQQSVVKKYLNDLDKDNLQQRWTVFTAHFHNPTIQQNILNAKEEEYQEGFVRDLFVDVFGYILNPQPDYNFVLEKKTEADSTKSDGAILQGGKVVAIIELKDTATTDLDKVEKQAFGYKHRHRECIYVITANFQKLRFYINDAIEYEEFDLFNLTQERFALLYLCLSEKTIFKNIPLLIKKASLTQEEAVTKKLYDDYSGFRKKLFHNIIELNPQYPKIELFQKTQKLLDRFLFILFAEDRLLLPPNSVREILRQWQQLKEMDAEVPLYERFKKYFGYLNSGHQGKQYEIFAYNGGLFASDEMLDHIKIDDAILYDSCMALSNYDFQTEIDVNILGHIFEHSLNEIEELQAEAKGDAIDKTKTRRKKEGIFYTPRYITKYIVANTVGALCEQKKEELSINEEVFAYRKRKDKKREDLVRLLDDYRHWLLQLTICDPACGSGAFLNQALEYLIAEHRYIDELKANLFGDAFVLTDLDNEILEHNLYGVDINEEAAEIARLSLWLRTAKKDRKLSSLNNHIQCGNSLIDDTVVAGDKAFNWQKAFPKIFEKGGFDAVIGNPPYGAELPEDIKKHFKKVFKISAEGKIDTYKLFFEKGFTLIKNNGLFSFITPNTFLYNTQSKKLRQLIINTFRIVDAVELRKNIFEDAPDVVTTILTLKKEKPKDYSFRARVAFPKKIYGDINNDAWDIDQVIPISVVTNDKESKINLRSNFGFYQIKLKMEKNKKLGDFFTLKQGTKPYGSKENKEIELLSKVKHDESWERAINGRNIARYKISFENDFVQRSEELHSCLPLNMVNGEKIYFQRMRKISLFPRLVASYDNENIHGLYTCSVIFKESNSDINLKYVLCLLNSLLVNLWYKYFDTDIEIKLISVKEVPIPNISIEQQLPFIAKADIMLAKNKELQEVEQQLLQLMQSNFPDVKLSKKLEQWPSLSFAELLKELSKQKIKPGLPQQSEWMNYFEEQKTKALALQKLIVDTDKEIDAMVYALYDLSEEEIKIVEGGG